MISPDMLKYADKNINTYVNKPYSQFQHKYANYS